MKIVNPKEVSIAEFHSYITGAVAPRPIAFASTTDKEGNVNLSPFSFFNAFGSNPPTLIFSPNRRVRDNSSKDTIDNVSETDEVVINMVDFAMVEQVSLASAEFPKGVNEFIKTGLTQEPSILVKPPRVKEAKVAFECKIKQVLTLGHQGGAPNLVICEILLAHVAEELLGENGRIDPTKTDWVARLGGDWYCRASKENMFRVPTPSRDLPKGVDQIPQFLVEEKMLTGNNLGRLGGLSQLPSEDDIQAFEALNAGKDFLLLAKKLIEDRKIDQAWKAIKVAEKQRVKI